MFEDLYSYRQEDLHIIYGVNCYQGALNNYVPVVKTYEARDGTAIICYIYPTPGYLDKGIANIRGRILAKKDHNAYANMILMGCAEDGLTNTGNKFIEAEGHLTLAVLFDQIDMDFHFMRWENGRWASKEPMKPLTYYETLEEFEVVSGYKFHSYLLAPEGTVPGHISYFRSRNARAKTDAGQINLLKHQIHTGSDPHMLKIRSLSLEIRPERGEAIFDFEGKNYKVPLPAWPLYARSPIRSAFSQSRSGLRRKHPIAARPLSLFPFSKYFGFMQR